MNFDNYLFRAHSVGNIMGGVPKDLTENQLDTYNSLLAKHKSNNKNLTYSQMNRYSFLMSKHKNPEKQLTERQEFELSQLILKYEATGKNLTLNQIETLGDLNRKRKTTLHLDDRAKRFLEKLVWQELTGRSNNIEAKTLDKGIMCEENSFTLYSNVTKSLFLNNKERRENEFLTGECDNAQGKIREVKTSWEYLTFPLMAKKPTSDLYPWQNDSYMDLWNLKEAELIYCLVDTPNQMINSELLSLHNKVDLFDGNGCIRKHHIELTVETVSRHIYTEKGLESFCLESSSVELDWFKGVFKELPEEMRIKIFYQDYCEKRNKWLKEMIVLAREYMNQTILDIGGNAIELEKYAS